MKQHLLTAAQSAQAMGPAPLPEIILHIPCVFSQEISASGCAEVFVLGHRQGIESAAELVTQLHADPGLLAACESAEDWVRNFMDDNPFDHCGALDVLEKLQRAIRTAKQNISVQHSPE